MRMSVQTYTWEQPLLARANEAFSNPALGVEKRFRTDPSLLDSAYSYCASVTKTSSRTFYLASSLLPGFKRRAVHALYAFCRATDDLVDESHAGQVDPNDTFTHWRLQLTNGEPASHNPIALAWTNAQA